MLNMFMVQPQRLTTSQGNMIRNLQFHNFLFNSVGLTCVYNTTRWIFGDLTPSIERHSFVFFYRIFMLSCLVFLSVNNLVGRPVRHVYLPINALRLIYGTYRFRLKLRKSHAEVRVKQKNRNLCMVPYYLHIFAPGAALW